MEELIKKQDNQIAKWRKKLAGYSEELSAVTTKRQELEAERNRYLLPAKEGRHEAEQALTLAREKLLVLSQEESELEILIIQVRDKVQELESQRQDIVKRSEVAKLNNLKDQRLAIAGQIEQSVNELVASLEKYREISDQMYTSAKHLQTSDMRLLKKHLPVNYIHARLSELFPTDFIKMNVLLRGSLISHEQDMLYGAISKLENNLKEVI